MMFGIMTNTELSEAIQDAEKLRSKDARRQARSRAMVRYLQGRGTNLYPADWLPLYRDAGMDAAADKLEADLESGESLKLWKMAV